MASRARSADTCDPGRGQLMEPRNSVGHVAEKDGDIIIADRSARSIQDYRLETSARDFIKGGAEALQGSDRQPKSQ